MAKKSKKQEEHSHKDGEKHSHKDGNKPHEHEITKATVSVKLGKVDVYKAKEKRIKFVDKIDEQIANLTDVYSPDYKTIDDTIESIKKACRKVCTSAYATNNVYLFLQDCLKKITLAEK